MLEPVAAPERLRLQKSTRVIAVTSGKGGVGKTNIVGALALFFSGRGQKVMILDADLGLSNIDVLFGLSPQRNIEHVIAGESKMSDIVVDGPGDVRILPASSGNEWLTHLEESQKMKLVDELDDFDEEVDVLLVDTGAGIAGNVLFFCEASHEIIVVVTPEPTSITDAYALVKVMSIQYGGHRFKVLVNMAAGASEGIETFRRLSVVADRFLNVSLDYLGYLSRDAVVHQAVRRQHSFYEAFPNTQISRDLTAVGRVLQDEPQPEARGGVQFFLKRLFGGVPS